MAADTSMGARARAKAVPAGRFARTVAAACVLTWIPHAAARAQDVSGALDGRVVDEAAAPIPQARVTVTGAALPGIRTTGTDEHGRFRFAGLPVGACAVEIVAIGHAPARREVVVVLGGTIALGTVVLRTQAIEIEPVVVAGRAPALDLRTTSAGGGIAASAFRNLPVDRDYQSVITATPVANASAYGDRANFDGLTGAESQYYLDGVRVVEPPGNSVSTTVPYNLLRAIEVRAAGYEAEYGGAGGAIVNAVTATGGDAFHGQVYGFFANRLLSTHDGTLRLPRSTTGYSAWDAGLALGGPLRRERLWYQLSYAPGVDTRRLDVAGIGALEDRRVTHRFAGRLTWRAQEQTTVDLSASGDPSERDQVGGVVIGEATTFGNVDPLLGDQPRRSINVALHATRVFGTHAFAEAGVSHSDYAYALAPRTERGRTEPLYIDTRTGDAEGGFGNIVERDAARSGARGSFSYERGRHSFKTGAGYEDESATETTDIHIVRRYGDSSYKYTVLDGRHTDNHIRVPMAFLQDSWQATDWLRLNAGLRWAGEYWITSGGDVGQRIPDAWQPRVGVVLHRGEQARSRLYGSAGRFHQQTRLNVLQYFMQDTPATYLILKYDHDPRIDPSGGSVDAALPLGRHPDVEGLRPAMFDELQLGGEYVWGSGTRTGVRAIERRQRDAIVGVLDPVTQRPTFGNPGRGELAAYPRIHRVYRALEWTVEREGRASFRASYVLSRSTGNYEGYWEQNAGDNDPTGAGSFVFHPSAAAYLEGALPNDRPHVAKLSGSVRVAPTFTVGTLFQVASGTPLSELGSTLLGPPYYVHLSPRGSLGRTPWLYDLDFRFAWEPARPGGRTHPRVIVDVYHVGNPRRTVFVDQVHYRGATPTGQQTTPNPNYGQPLALQPGTAFRFGLEADW